MARKYGRAAHVAQSLHEVLADPARGGRGHGARGRCGSARASRTRPANVTASNTNGSDRATPYRSPPSGPPTRAAMWWRAWFWLSAVGSSSWARLTGPRTISAGPKTPAPTPVSSATTIRWGDGQRVRDRRRRRASRRASTPEPLAAEHQPPPVRAVGHHAGGQQRGRPCRAVNGHREAGEHGRPGERVAHQREHEHAHRLPSWLIASPVQRAVKSWLRARLRYAVMVTYAQHILRNS